MRYDETMMENLLRTLYAAADACRRCESGIREPTHPKAQFARSWLRNLGDTISNAASAASNERAAFDSVVDGIDRKSAKDPTELKV